MFHIGAYFKLPSVSLLSQPSSGLTCTSVLGYPKLVELTINLSQIDGIFLDVCHENIIYFPSKKEPELMESARKPKDTVELGGKE